MLTTTDDCMQCKCPKWAKWKERMPLTHTNTQQIETKMFFFRGRMQSSHFTNWITWKGGQGWGCMTWHCNNIQMYHSGGLNYIRKFDTFLMKFCFFALSLSFSLSLCVCVHFCHITNNNNNKKHRENNNETNLLFWSLSVLLSDAHIQWSSHKANFILSERQFLYFKRNDIFFSRYDNISSWNFIKVTRFFISWREKKMCHCFGAFFHVFFFLCDLEFQCFWLSFNIPVKRSFQSYFRSNRERYVILEISFYAEIPSKFHKHIIQFA